MSIGVLHSTLMKLYYSYLFIVVFGQILLLFCEYNCGILDIFIKGLDFNFDYFYMYDMDYSVNDYTSNLSRPDSSTLLSQRDDELPSRYDFNFRYGRFIREGTQAYPNPLNEELQRILDLDNENRMFYKNN